jgi:DNA-binding transcriptional ArsR family regulator
MNGTDVFTLHAPENIEIISTGDERLKIIGKELADDTGRAIFTTICQRGVASPADVAKLLDISLPLVNWHVHRLLNSGLIKIEKLAMSQKNKPVKYYGPASTIIVIGIALGEYGKGGIGSNDGNESNDNYLTRKRLATREIWSRLTRSVSAALVSFITATGVIYAIGRTFTAGSINESDLAGDNGIKLADPDAIAGAPATPPVDSLPSLLNAILPSSLVDIVIALLGGALVGATVLIALKISRQRA